MKHYIATFFRNNPQLENGGYKSICTIEAKTIASARKKAQAMSDRVLYGSLELLDIRESED